ncbi:MAG TPA: hypothetical protein VFY91_18720 [Microbacterium sp.]|nr:hypothetical protein [Microbacterium sp.]
MASLVLWALPSLEVDIDVQPRDGGNAIDLSRDPLVSVALLSSPTFDPHVVLLPSIRFGRTGTEASLSTCGGPSVDLNDDGRPDLVCVFVVRKAAWRSADATGTLRARTAYGLSIEATAPVTLRTAELPALRRTGPRL